MNRSLSTSAPWAPGSLQLGLSLLAAGALISMPAASKAGPAGTTPDCLRPPAAARLDSSDTVLRPGGSSAPQLMAQALPAGNGPAVADRTGGARLIAQASAPETLPACTYDPPRPPAPQIIRGLW